MIKAGKKYKFRCDSGVYLCVYTDALGTLFRNIETNHNFSASPDNLKLWTEYVEPKKGTVWLNVYENPSYGITQAHMTRELADRGASKNRLACVEVQWTEGDGLV